MAVAVTFCLLTINTASEAKTPKEIYRDSKDSVFLLVSIEEKGKFSTGSAFAISKHEILTAAHVVEDAKELVLVDRNQMAYPVKETVWVDKDLDLAIVRVADIEMKALPVKSYKDSEVGEKLTIISYPKGGEVGGLETTLSEGLLSSVREKFVSEREDEYSPTYDRLNPQIIKKDLFYKNLDKNCKSVALQNEQGLKLIQCKDGKYAIVDESSDNTVIYENYDIAVKVGDSVYLYENKNKKIPKVHKTLGAMIQYTTPISSGSSGGPIFNENGEVIAIVNSYLEDAQNVNFGRPTDYIPAQFITANTEAVKAVVLSESSKQKVKSDAKLDMKKCMVDVIRLSERLQLFKCTDKKFVVVDLEEQNNKTVEVGSYQDLIMRHFSLLDTKHE
jgi:hypothetical protein